MRLHQTQSPGNMVTAYGQGFIEINRVRYTTPLLLWPERLEAWTAPMLELFSKNDLLDLVAQGPEVILIGTGASVYFQLFPLLKEQDVGIEIMTTAAALHTFNFLMAEGRQVLAALYLP